jgi:predicted dehydrogenase
MTRIAIMGYGAIAQKHIEVFRSLGAEIVASCNRSQAGRDRAFAAGIPSVFGDIDEMVDRSKPQAILVTASAMSIYDVACQCLEYGLPLLIEKPPGTSLAQVRDLAARADERRVPVMVGLNRRFYSVYHNALQVLGGREAVTGVDVEWSEDPQKMLSIGHPRPLIERLVFANSLHGIDFIPFFTGSPSDMRSWGRDLDTSHSAYCWQMEASGMGQWGARFTFRSNWDVPGRWRLVVDGPDGRMVSAPLETATLLRRGHAAEELKPDTVDQQFKAGFHGQAKFFLDIIREQRSLTWPACSLQEAVLSMKIAEKMTGNCRAQGTEA